MSAQTKPRSSRDLDDVPFITGSVHAFLQNRHLDESEYYQPSLGTLHLNESHLPIQPVPVHPQSYASKYTVGPPLKLKWIQVRTCTLSIIVDVPPHFLPSMNLLSPIGPQELPFICLPPNVPLYRLCPPDVVQCHSIHPLRWSWPLWFFLALVLCRGQ